MRDDDTMPDGVRCPEKGAERAEYRLNRQLLRIKRGRRSDWREAAETAVDRWGPVVYLGGDARWFVFVRDDERAA